MDELANIMQTKYESKRKVIQSLMSKGVCNEVEEAYKKTVLNPLPVGADTIDIESMRDCTVVILFYVNKIDDDNYDDLVILDLAKDPPLIDILAKDKMSEYNMIKTLEADQATSDQRREEGLYTMVALSEYLEKNNLETHCVFKLPDLADEAIYKMAYNN